MRQHEKLRARKKKRSTAWLEAKAFARRESEKHAKSFSVPPGSGNPKKLKGVKAEGERPKIRRSR